MHVSTQPTLNYIGEGKERTMPIGRLYKLKAPFSLFFFWVKLLKVYTIPSVEDTGIFCSLLLYGFDVGMRLCLV